jgi:hypothetical protein
MTLPHPYKCDYCDKTKGDSNHWWMRDPASPSGFFVLSVWDDTIKDVEGVEHICGEACATKALSKFMAGAVPQ